MDLMPEQAQAAIDAAQAALNRGGQAIVDFGRGTQEVGGGFKNAYVSNQLFGIGREQPRTINYAAGQFAADKFSQAEGAVNILGGLFMSGGGGFTSVGGLVLAGAGSAGGPAGAAPGTIVLGSGVVITAGGVISIVRGVSEIYTSTSNISNPNVYSVREDAPGGPSENPQSKVDGPRTSSRVQAEDDAGGTRGESPTPTSDLPPPDTGGPAPTPSAPQPTGNPVFPTRVEFTPSTGRAYQVFQRGDINWDQIRTAGAKEFIGKTNAEAARAGLRPQLPDGNFASIHHAEQNANGPWFEVSTKYHNISTAKEPPLHPYEGGQNPDAPLGKGEGSRREEFQRTESPEYWKWRAANQGKAEPSSEGGQ